MARSPITPDSIAPLREWVLSVESRALDGDAFFAALCERLVELGLPLVRAYTALRTKNPEVHVEALEWERKTRLKPINYRHGTLERPEYQQSPVAALLDGGLDFIRVHLERDDDELPFLLCRELKAQGATDYLIIRLEGGKTEPSVISFAIDREGGYSDDEVEALHGLARPLAVRVELESVHRASDSLLETYLGKNAAQRVLDGEFLRGRGTAIDAAIWMSDLRSFTALVDRHDEKDVLTALDAYFGAVGEAIHAAGGEILKFIGDAILAVFPLDGSDAAGACTRALDAALDAQQRMDALNQSGALAHLGTLCFGVALHRGVVYYGNIGSSARLDFTVIGRAVNEVSRIEGFCKNLDEDILVSASFADAVDGARLRSLGEHRLRGVSHPVELFGVAR